MIREDPSLRITWKELVSPGYMICDVPREYMKELDTSVDSLIQNNFNSEPMNQQLAGNLKHEYKLDMSDMFKSFIVYSCALYNQKHFDALDKKPFMNPRFSDIWVNFQRKGEFNPIHTHSGDYSFVIWYKVPFVFEEELKNESSSNANGQTVSCFQFQYNNALGKICADTLAVDKSWEGKMALFPAGLNHCVYPFYTSDEYRISVAGNITIQENL